MIIETKTAQMIAPYILLLKINVKRENKKAAIDRIKIGRIETEKFITGKPYVGGRLRNIATVVMAKRTARSRYT